MRTAARQQSHLASAKTSSGFSAEFSAETFATLGIRPAGQLAEEGWRSSPLIAVGSQTVTAAGLPALPSGQVSEWGLSVGGRARELIMGYVAAATAAGDWCLWVSPPAEAQGLVMYPPAWAARGVRLEHLRVARTEHPLRDLKSVFMDHFFRLIVIDAGEHAISDEDGAFLARQLRVRGGHVMVLRSRLLVPERSNVWARLRMNIHPGDASAASSAASSATPQHVPFNAALVVPGSCGHVEWLKGRRAL